MNRQTYTQTDGLRRRKTMKEREAAVQRETDMDKPRKAFRNTYKHTQRRTNRWKEKNTVLKC